MTREVGSLHRSPAVQFCETPRREPREGVVSEPEYVDRTGIVLEVSSDEIATAKAELLKFISSTHAQNVIGDLASLQDELKCIRRDHPDPRSAFTFTGKIVSKMIQQSELPEIVGKVFFALQFDQVSFVDSIVSSILKMERTSNVSSGDF